jgi:hypothetical protein
MEQIKCPFCKEEGFDKIGLKHHLAFYCQEYNNTNTILQEQKSCAKCKHENTKTIDGVRQLPCWACLSTIKNLWEPKEGESYG